MKNLSSGRALGKFWPNFRARAHEPEQKPVLALLLLIESKAKATPDSENPLWTILTSASNLITACKIPGLILFHYFYNVRSVGKIYSELPVFKSLMFSKEIAAGPQW